MQLLEVMRAIEGSREYIAKIMCDMISIPAMSPAVGGEGESKRADFLQGYLKDFDSVQRVDVPDEDHPGIMRSNILAKKNGKRSGTVWIIAHIDTVPAGNLADWETDPFKGIYRDGKVYGRGTEDNGQSVLSSMFASRFFEKGTLEGMSIGVAWVADEEMASHYGVCHLIDNGYFSPDDIFLVPDWGSPDGKYIEVNEKSLIWLQFDIVGKSVHASTPDIGINAFRLGAAIIDDVIVALNERFPMENPMFLPAKSSFEPTKADSTVLNVNTIPGSWSFCMDCRILPDYKVEDVLKTAQDIASRYEATGAKITVKELQRHESGGKSSTDSPVFKALSDSVEEVLGHRPEATGVGGATCANFFRLKGYDAYVWETGGGTLHGPNEYVPVQNIINDAKVFATLFYKLCVSPQ
ncbi:acetylornithine deacetylase or succinyl-diaminopimelate desuccinylase [Thermoplasmatales archaeon BRNA1]|nr:acetylornithine deacetylase or succinyl-diaminopimelate desuccinylase [Thermoplasmatales archaeon BRNA1]